LAWQFLPEREGAFCGPGIIFFAMPQKYYNVKDAAQLLGISEDEVRKMQENRELYGYRDGADWKFKAEEIEKLAASRPAPATPVEESSEEVLLSEVELGQSSIGTSGTVIGMESPGNKALDSDLAMALGSDLNLASDSEIHLGSDLATSSSAKLKAGSSSPFEELDLTLEEDVSLEDSGVDLLPNQQQAAAPPADSSSVVSAQAMDDDDMVLGTGSSSSGLGLGGDSGIMLVDPHDSGLSLEEPLDLAGSKSESLVLGEDEMLSLSGSSKKGQGSSVKGDDDFLLTPLEEAGDAEESESGSQVIALDTDSDDASTMIANTPIPTMGAMLEEDLGSTSGVDFGSSPSLGTAALATASFATPSLATADAAASPAATFVPELPYTPLQITGLIICTLFLMLCGMMMYDMVRHIWSWDGGYTAISPLMEMILKWFS
jgi:excisionase family DNA binding protein